MKDTKDFKHVETIKVDKINDFKKNKIVSDFFPNVKNNIMNDKMDPVDFFKLTDDMNQKTMKNEKKLAKIFSQKKPIMTYLLIVINVMLFLISTIYPSIQIYLGNNYLFVQDGDFYRLFTCMFLHSNLMHLLFNMYALYVLGPQVERYYGKAKFLTIYFVSGLLGSVFSCVFMPENAISIGASGAIFGLLGSIAYFTYYYRATLQNALRNQVMPVILINLLLGFVVADIDVFAHIGGLIGGLLISMGIGIGDKGRKSDQINGIIVLILMFIFMLYMTFNK